MKFHTSRGSHKSGYSHDDRLRKLLENMSRMQNNQNGKHIDGLLGGA